MVLFWLVVGGTQGFGDLGAGYFSLLVLLFRGGWFNFFYSLLQSHEEDLTTEISVILAVDLGSNGIH